MITKSVKLRFMMIMLRMVMQIYIKIIGETSDVSKANKLYKELLDDYHF